MAQTHAQDELTVDLSPKNVKSLRAQWSLPINADDILVYPDSAEFLPDRPERGQVFVAGQRGVERHLFSSWEAGPKVVELVMAFRGTAGTRYVTRLDGAGEPPTALQAAKMNRQETGPAPCPPLFSVVVP